MAVFFRIIYNSKNYVRFFYCMVFLILKDSDSVAIYGKNSSVYFADNQVQ